MLEQIQQSAQRNRPGLWWLLAALLFVQILPLHVHNHSLNQEPAVSHHHNVMTYIGDADDDIADTQVMTVDLDLHGLSQSGDVDMPVLLFALLLLLALAVCFRCLGLRASEASASYPSGSYRLPPLRAPPAR